MVNCYKLVGTQHKTGEYEGYKYDNVVMFCEYTDDCVDGTGVLALKVKRSIFETFGIKVGQSFHPFYDQYRNVNFIQIVSDGK